MVKPGLSRMEWDMSWKKDESVFREEQVSYNRGKLRKARGKNTDTLHSRTDIIGAKGR